MKKYTVSDILDKLIGSTAPYGESNHDSEALDRLDDITDVIEWVIGRLFECRRARNNYQGSMILLAKTARNIAECYIDEFKDLAKPSEVEIKREAQE
jgi:hypothetical protein